MFWENWENGILSTLESYSEYLYQLFDVLPNQTCERTALQVQVLI